MTDRSGSSLITRCKRTFVGFWLASLYVICVFSVIYSLSSFQIQNRLALIPYGDLFIDHKCKASDPSYDNVNPISDEESLTIVTRLCIPNSSSKISYIPLGKILGVIADNKRIEILSRDIIAGNSADNKLNEKLKEVQENLDNYLKKEPVLDIKRIEVRKEGQNINSSIAKAKADKEILRLSRKDNIEALKNIDIARRQITDEKLNILIRKTIEGNNQKIDEELTILSIAAEENNKKTDEALKILEIAAAENIKKTEQDNPAHDLKFLFSARAANSEILEFKKKEKDQYIKENLWSVDILSNIGYYDNFFEWFTEPLGLPAFWSLPKSILTLLLVLSTGVLGSIIFVTVEFLKEPEDKIQNLNMYLFRPFLGMILALAIYVMLKAGQFTFVDDSNQDLSPFLVSFLGIISGMLAEQAYSRLTKTGGVIMEGKA
ncbi:MAG: hypothetical protein ACI84K_001388 [Pseudohongiellaceae bacterium]|jgi:hypothetical protein